ncbi:MAG: hypothetical protein HYZ75_16580 [Elusimicrobia bacterium]|nr:hypothetical protein [Elusimicrobiota bacterium]
MRRTAPLLAAILALQGSPAWAGGSLTAAMRGMAFSLLGAMPEPAEVDAPPAGAQVGAAEQPDAVLGIFKYTSKDPQTQEPRTEFWRWAQKDATLASDALQATLGEGKPAGVRPINALLTASPAGSWLVMRREGEPVFLFTDGKDPLWTPIPPAKTYGDRTLPLTMRREGERLRAEYGSAASGTLETHEFTAGKGDTLLGYFTFGKDPKTKRPALSSAFLFADVRSIDELAKQPGIEGSKGIAALRAKKDVLERLGAQLKGEAFFSVTPDQHGDMEFKLHQDSKDSVGTSYLYTIGGEVLEVSPPAK